MMGISRQTDYAVRVVMHLACLEEGARVPLGDIAEYRGLPLAFVRRLIKPLVAKGILSSARGSNGGVRLARHARDISLLDVVTAIEGGMGLNHCEAHHRACPQSGACPVHDVWTDATQLLADHLAAIRFDALASAAAR